MRFLSSLSIFRRRRLLPLLLFIFTATSFLSFHYSLLFKNIITKHTHCHNCTRRGIVTADCNDNITYEETTCGPEAYRRGSGQKVISYSYYHGESDGKRGYLDGIRANLELIPKLYPGYVMRLYTDLEPGDAVLEQLCYLSCGVEDSVLDLCHVETLPGTPMVDARGVFPMVWRFFPTLDPQVDVVNSRDLDGRISERELAAVEEWLRIGEPVHSMRDHPHHGAEILGGCWGADLRRKDSREKWKKSWETILKDGNFWMKKDQGSGGPDQKLLRDHVWSWASNESVQHDSYLCDTYPGSLPWPVERREGVNNYLAATIADNVSLWVVCPRECRPREHPEWEHC